MVDRANNDFLCKTHYRELEVRVKRQLREVDFAHAVGLVDVEQNVIAMLEVGKYALLSGLQIHALSNVTTVITDTEVTGLGRFETDYSTSLGTDTATEDVTCVLEVTGLVVAITNAPPLLDKRRKRSQAEALQRIIVDIVIAGVMDILAFSVKR